MKICDLTQEQIVPGLQIKGMYSGMLGTITKVDPKDDDFATIEWENGRKGGFYGTNCECEVVNLGRTPAL